MVKNVNNDSTLGKENSFKTSAIKLKKKSIAHLSILIAMHDHIYDIKIMYKKYRRRKKRTRLLQLTKVNLLM